MNLSSSSTLSSSSNNNIPDIHNRTTGGNPHHQANDPHVHRSSPSSSTPSASSVPMPKYVYDMPYPIRKKLCDLLDADGSWRQLGGEYIGLNETQLTLISHALFRGASPTNDLLVKWEQTNPSITTLFKSLAQMKHVRALLILKPVVDPNLAESLIQQSRDNDSQLMPSSSQTSVLSSMVKTNPSAPYEMIGAVGGYASDDMKHHHDYVNCGKKDDVVKKDLMVTMINPEIKVLNTATGGGVWNDFNQPNIITDVTKAGSGATGALTPHNMNSSTRVESAGIRGSLGSLASRQSEVEEDLEVLYKELLLATDDFCSDNIIGSGGFGVVYRGEWKGTQVIINYSCLTELILTTIDRLQSKDSRE